MSLRKRFLVRREADTDFDAALDRYLIEAGEAVACRFLDAVADAHRLIADNPGVGALRWSTTPGLEDVRAWSVRGFPYQLVYRETPDSIEIWRLLHGNRDFPELLSQASG